MSSQFTETGLRGGKDGIVQKRFNVFEGDALTGNLVHVKVTHCGLCFTDTHFLKKDICLGHEPVGVVESLGPDCKQLKKGDVVQWGYLHSSCNQCEMCWTGKEVLCAKRSMYGYADKDLGGFSTGGVVREDYLFKVPDSISPAHASVLSCGGVTVFSAMYNNNIKPTDRVGVVGLGGLGHLALKTAHAWGCHVTAFSRTNDKEEEARSFGAHEFVTTKGKETLSVENKLDFLLVTVSGQVDWKMYYSVMKPRGRIIAMGVDHSGQGANLPYGQMLSQEMSFAGSLVASRQVHALMLEFFARHAITPVIEEMEMTKENLETAIERLEKGDVRYRFVLYNKLDKAEPKI
ncbi:NADP-dependent alcohol dehydrogenase [Protomyces lactucae-debilis]|uniref:NADP-dependent alcohol dehydrogenase n=1 Tax=Protomyces lactucae-debilis TaxID=2754530 RepID=A0A1Y2ET61_PROLT|nr:NADP-dependent alcohol dehydrogenase [Protomyces lactucae-debilis]ORY74346.1 NADP-dependent alcohol dehydrogenase [Protomyces lactucae-debilis]